MSGCLRLSTDTVTFGSGKPVACGFASSSDCCADWRVLSGTAAKSAFATALLMLAATMPEPAIAVSKLMGMVSPAFGDRGPVTISIAFAPRWRAASALYRRSAYRARIAFVFCSASSGK